MTIHPEEAIVLGLLVGCVALILLYPEEAAHYVLLFTRLA